MNNSTEKVLHPRDHVLALTLAVLGSVVVAAIVFAGRFPL